MSLDIETGLEHVVAIVKTQPLPQYSNIYVHVVAQFNVKI